MKNKRLAIFLIISLAFNMAVLGVFLAHWLREDSGGESYCDPQQCRTFARRFGLNPPTAERFSTEMSRFRKDERKLRAGISESRMELMELLHSPEPDSGMIDRKVEEISELQGELEKIMVRRLLRVNSVLSDSEKVRFHRILRRRMCRDRPPHPPVLERGGNCEEL